MSALDKHKQYAIDWIDENARRFSDFHLEIWNYAEPAWREYKSAKAYCDLLSEEGFTVEQGSGEMPTAFAASWGKGGPILGSYAEYDAVPGNSQQVVPYQAPRKGLHPWAAGHTDPHSALGTTALAGVLATKAAMEKFGIAGTIKFFGEPAEKVCGSKPVHAAKGYFDGFDAFISYHPHFSNTTVWDTQCGSYWSVVFTFEALEPEKWIDKSLMPTKHTSHAVARCPGAIDALCLMYTTTKYTKEAMFPHTGTWTLNEFVMVGGDATSDNLPPRFSQIQYSWRSPTLGIQQQIYNVLANNARHAAAATGCQVSVRWITKTRVGLTNHAMADLTFRNMELVGPPKLNEEAREFAPQDPSQSRPEADGESVPRGLRAADAAAGVRGPTPESAAGMAAELHLGRLRRLYVACADGTPLDHAAAPAPAKRRLRLPGLDRQRSGRAAGGDQPRHLPRSQDDRSHLHRPVDQAGVA